MQEKYLIITFLTSLGTLIGLVLSKISPEELTNARPYLIRILDAIFLTVILLLAYYNLTRLTIFPLAIFLLFYWYKEATFKRYYILEFIILGMLFALGYIQELFIYTTALIFIYTAASNILLAEKLKHKKHITLYKLTALRIIYFCLGSLIIYAINFRHFL
jgi:hypothetical protein